MLPKPQVLPRAALTRRTFINPVFSQYGQGLSLPGQFPDPCGPGFLTYPHGHLLEAGENPQHRGIIRPATEPVRDRDAEGLHKAPRDHVAKIPEPPLDLHSNIPNKGPCTCPSITIQPCQQAQSRSQRVQKWEASQSPHCLT